MKTCKICGEQKPLELFQKEKRCKDGYAGRCKSCVKESSAKWRRENPEKSTESNRAGYAKNRESRLEYAVRRRKLFAEQINARQRSYHERTKPERLETLRRYRKANPEVFRIAGNRRRARKISLPDTLTTEEYSIVVAMFEGKCALCDEQSEHLDHFVPIASGHGGTTLANSLPLCAEMNQSKGARNPFEWIKTRADIDKATFSEAVAYLAELNDRSAEEYETYVYSCFD